MQLSTVTCTLTVHRIWVYNRNSDNFRARGYSVHSEKFDILKFPQLWLREGQETRRPEDRVAESANYAYTRPELAEI